MATAKKRYTDAFKWDDPWFGELDIKDKLFWFYILDKCDHAGLIEFYRRKFEFDLDFEIDINRIKDVFKKRIVFLTDDKWFIPGFITFQYNELNQGCKPHLSVMKALQRVGIDYTKFCIVLAKGYEPVKDKDIDKDIDKDKEPAKPIKYTQPTINPIQDKWNYILTQCNVNPKEYILTSDMQLPFRDIVNDAQIGMDGCVRALKNFLGPPGKWHRDQGHAVHWLLLTKKRVAEWMAKTQTEKKVRKV